jgi:cell division protein FtsN
MRGTCLKKRYQLDISYFQYFLSILAFILIGGLLFSLGLMVGLYHSRSSYEHIITPEAEIDGENKVTILKVADEDSRPEISHPPQVEETSVKKPATPIIHSKVYCVQVGSFKRKADAIRFRDKLRKKKYKAFVNSADLGKKGVWYRVRVGKLRKKKEAEKLAEFLLKKEKLKGLVLKGALKY